MRWAETDKALEMWLGSSARCFEQRLLQTVQGGLAYSRSERPGSGPAIPVIDQIEKLAHRLRVAVKRAGRELYESLRIARATPEERDEFLPGVLLFGIVGNDSLRLDTEAAKNQGSEDSGAVLPGGAVKDDWLKRGNCLEGLYDAVFCQVEVAEIAVDQTRLNMPCLVIPLLLKHGKVHVAQGFVLERSKPIICDFPRAPKVKNSRHPDLVPDDRDIDLGQFLKAVTAKNATVTSLSTIGSLIPAKIPKVECPR